MAIDMTPEQRTVGEQNFQKAKETLGLDRRSFLKAGILGAGALGGSAAAVYFGYQSIHGNPVRTALIGGGDEGGVLVGEHNPEFLKFVAVADIRPSNLRRIYEGEPAGLRKGFKRIYGHDCDQPRRGKLPNSDYIEAFVDWEEMLKKRKDIEAVVIALPLHLHAPVAIRAMEIGAKRGKPIHVLCEKLMAWNVKQCKQMIKVAKRTGSILSIGHQRHYSMLYSHAQEVLKSDVLGDIKHIRALWHRNFSWPYVHDPKKGKPVPGILQPTIRDGWFGPVTEEDYKAVEPMLKDLKLYGKPQYDTVTQLIRWRLDPETGGGLMAELGSHQLDACSIFLGKVRPLTVQGFGGTLFFDRIEPGKKPTGNKNPRKIDDHVFVTYTFPGKNYYKRDDKGNIDLDNNKRPILADENDKVVVTYSSVSTNSFEQYGECLMGTRGTMIVEAEQRVMLFAEKDPTKKGTPRLMEVSVTVKKPDESAADASSTWGGPSASVTASPTAATAAGPVSRGYREEMEDFAYCVRMWNARQGYEEKADQKKDGQKKADRYVQRLPRCHGEVAMADAIIALAANEAMRKGERLTFKDEWFDADSPAMPDWSKDGEKIICDVELGADTK
jgi:predicted dehydrogenase